MAKILDKTSTGPKSYWSILRTSQVKISQYYLKNALKITL